MKKQLFAGLATVALGAAAIAGAITLNRGVSTETKADLVTTYEKMVAGDAVAVNDVVVITYNSVELSGISNTKTKYGLGTEFAGVPSGSFAFTVTASDVDGTFQLVNNNNYLTWTSGNSLNVADSSSANTKWSISIDDSGNAVIVNSADNARKIRYNASSPRFACYTSGQSDIQLYKQVQVEQGAVTGVTLDKSFEPMLKGTSLTLNATIVPEDATDTEVTWSSSDETVATVVDGVVTGVASGAATITVTTHDGGFTASCVVMVTEHLGTAADPFTAKDAVLVANTAGTSGTPRKFYVQGTVKDMTIKTDSSGATGHIEDDNVELYLYRFKDINGVNFSDTGKIKVGDTIVLETNLSVYSNAPQGAYGTLISVTSNVALVNAEMNGDVTIPQYVGEAWDFSELSILGTYSDDSHGMPTDASYTVTPAAPTTAGEQEVTFNITAEGQNFVSKKTIAVLDAVTETSSDSFSYADLVGSGTGYQDGTYDGARASYAVKSYRDGSQKAIQIRTNNSDSGIISTARGGKYVKSVSVAYDTTSNQPKELWVYASKTPFEGIGDLFGNLAKVATLTGTHTSVNLPVDAQYVGIRSSSGAAYLATVTYTYADYLAADVVDTIKTLAGGWDHDEATENCAANYKAAKEMILMLSDVQRALFVEGTDAETAAARETYLHWCEVNGDANPYSGEIVSGASFSAQLAKNAVTNGVVIGAIALVAAAAIGLCIYRAKRKENN